MYSWTIIVRTRRKIIILLVKSFEHDQRWVGSEAINRLHKFINSAPMWKTKRIFIPVYSVQLSKNQKYIQSVFNRVFWMVFKLYRIRIYILSLGPFKLAKLPDKLQNNYHFCRVVVRVEVHGGGGENIHILLYIKIT